MKVAVYRPKKAEGLGEPIGFLDDEHPTEGDWVQSAKFNIPDNLELHYRLHLMGRDFLIYSMYHAREPRFLGYAVENFGAACKAMGLKLPLKEEEAVWLTYERSEIDDATPEWYRHLFHHIATVFGPDAAKAQAKALGIEWPTILTPAELAERMKKDILEDVKNGVVPATVESFSQLHDFVDANCYGGTEALLDEMSDAAPHTNEGYTGALNALCDLCNPAMDIVDAWIKAGGIREASKGWTSRFKRPPETGHER